MYFHVGYMSNIAAKCVFTSAALRSSSAVPRLCARILVNNYGRRFSAVSGNVVDSLQAHETVFYGNLLDTLMSRCYAVPARADDIDVLESPAQFYDEMLVSSNTRVFCFIVFATHTEANSQI